MDFHLNNYNKLTNTTTCLVTGGLGYIGSHLCVELLKNNFNVIIIDNLSNTSLKVMDIIVKITGKYPKVYIGDILDLTLLEEIFSKYKFDYVYHLAGLKSVSESQNNKYVYDIVNEIGTKNILHYMEKYGLYNMIFSSSAAVYGNNSGPFCEFDKVGEKLISNYARNKYNVEQMLH